MINRDVAVKMIKASGDVTRVMGDVVMDANERLEEYLTSVMEHIASHCEGLEDGAVIEVDDGETPFAAPVHWLSGWHITS